MCNGGEDDPSCWPMREIKDSSLKVKDKLNILFLSTSRLTAMMSQCTPRNIGTP